MVQQLLFLISWTSVQTFAFTYKSFLFILCFIIFLPTIYNYEEILVVKT